MLWGDLHKLRWYKEQINVTLSIFVGVYIEEADPL